MARKPNYNFERAERDRQKAAKKAEKIAAKRERAQRKREGGEDATDEVSEDGVAADED